MDRQTDGRTDGWTDGQTDGRMDGPADGPTDGPMDGGTHPLIESWLTTKNIPILQNFVPNWRRFPKTDN